MGAGETIPAGRVILSWIVFSAVLLAAAMHAGWNTLVKLNRDGTAVIMLIMISGGVFALPLALFAPAPRHPGVWLLAISVPVHILYYIWLEKALAAGGMGQVYPLARGAAPLITALVSALILGENLTGQQWTAIIILSSGIMLMALRGGVSILRGPAVRFALTTSVFIAVYTLIDGWGGRLSGSGAGFAAWLMMLEAPVITAIAPLWGGPGIYRRMRRVWKPGLAGGMLTTAAYPIVVWAMGKAPVAAIAALRESSILFAIILSALFLSEGLSRWRMVSGLLILAGVIGLRFGS